MDELKTEEIPTEQLSIISDEELEDMKDFPDNKDDQVKWIMKRDGLKNSKEVLKILHSFKVGPMNMNDFINIMKTAGTKSAITAMYEYEKEYKEIYGSSLSVIGSAVKRKLLNKKLIQIMDRIKYEKEMTGPRPKIRPENTATAMIRNIESAVYENKQNKASSKIGALLKGNSARRKVARMKEKQIDKGTSDYFDDIIDDVINATKRKRMKLRDIPESKSHTNDHKDYIKSKNNRIEKDAVNIQSAIRGAISRKKVEALQDIKQADLEKQGQLSEITTKAQPGKTNPYIEYRNYKELKNIQPYIITHKAFKDNIKQNIHGAQSARNLMYYIEQNEVEALKYVKNNKKYIPEYIQKVENLDQLKKAIKNNIFIDKSISVVLKSSKVDKSEGVETRQMASSSQPQTRSKAKKAELNK